MDGDQMNKVRYLTISRVSLELVEKLSDQENAQFNRIIFSCFQQLENGQPLSYQDTESPILNVALREAAAELETGYRNYIQKINARKKAPADQDDLESESAIDQRSISDQPPTDNRREEKREEKKRSEESRSRKEGMQGGRLFSDLEQAQLNAALNNAFLSPDPAFWSVAQKVGYRITLDAIGKAAEMRTRSIPYVVKLMEESAKGGIS